MKALTTPVTPESLKNHKKYEILTAADTGEEGSGLGSGFGLGSGLRRGSDCKKEK